jgi:hypothetical protein
MGEGMRKEQAMATTLEDLEKRVIALEQELLALRSKLDLPPDPKPWWWDIPMIRKSREQQAAVSAAVAEAYEKMGITASPVGPEKLQEMMLADGVDPNDNSASREIIAMREE